MGLSDCVSLDELKRVKIIYILVCYRIQQKILCGNCPRQRLKANNDGENFVKRRGGQLEMGSERQTGLHQLGSQ